MKTGVFFWWGIVAIGVCGCVPWLASVDTTFESVGEPSNGLLLSRSEFVPDPQTAVVYRSFQRTSATSELVALIEDAARRLSIDNPGTRLMVGDFSQPGGGKISEHASHRSGRDVDLAFLLTKLDGGVAEPIPMAELDRFGLGLRGKRVVRFDVARNWELVAALLSSDRADVQWIFVSNGLKAQLLSHALKTGASEALLDRAERVLRQPSDSADHSDHFHVRVFCPRGDAGGFCSSGGPPRPWRPQIANNEITDEKRLTLALEGLSSPPAP